MFYGNFYNFSTNPVLKLKIYPLRALENTGFLKMLPKERFTIFFTCSSDKMNCTIYYVDDSVGR